MSQNCQGIFLKCWGTSHSTSEQGLQYFIVLLKLEKYLLKNNTIGNRLLFSELANTEFTCPENSSCWLLLPDSNLFLKFQNNFAAEFWVTISYGLLLQRFFWNSSGIFITSIEADTRNFSKKYQQNFLLDAIFFEQ